MYYLFVLALTLVGTWYIVKYTRKKLQEEVKGGKQKENKEQ